MSFAHRFGPKYSGLAAALLAVVLSGCHSKPSLTPQQATGKHVYQVGCAHCHEDNDLNLKKVPPNLQGLFNHATLPDGTPATDAQIKRILMTGKGMMPSFAYQMSNQQMDDVIAYLHTGLR